MDLPNEKYPRTYHLPWSPGGTSDDKRLVSLTGLIGEDLILTEKADGSNVCLEAEHCYARSHSAAPSHPSFAAFKAFHATVKSRIPWDLQIFGEWLWAKHSIHYTALPSYFLPFGVRSKRTWRWASWEEVELWAEELGVPTVTVLWRGRVDSDEALKSRVEYHARAAQGSLGGEIEGCVVRVASEFHEDAFSRSVAKYVRANHVTTPDHWKHQAIVRNLLAGGR